MILSKLIKVIKRIFNHILSLINMGVLHSDKTLNDFVNSKFQELLDYTNNPTETLFGDKVSELVPIKQIGTSFEFTTLSWDYVLTREVDATVGKCILKTHRLVLDENDYPKKKMEHLPDMDIIIQLPFSSQESFRFAKDNFYSQIVGRDAEGTPLTVQQNKSYIAYFPKQYFGQLYANLGIK